MNQTVIKDPKTVRKIVEAERKRSRLIDDKKLSSLKKAEVGSPVLILTPEGNPSYWLVPLLEKGFACGFVSVELSGRVSRLGIFGSAPEDSSSWIDGSFFEKPPPKMLFEIEAKYLGLTISKPIFSYDANPSRWAWRVEIRDKDQIRSVVFMTPGGWYERASETISPGSGNEL